MSFQPTAYQNTALTFGVEIEFCIASLNQGFEDPHPHSASNFRSLDADFNHTAVPEFYPESEPQGFREWCIQLRMARALSAAGFPSVTEKEINFAGKYPENERLARWIVTDDSSLRAPDTDFKYTWYKIEINSPAFYYDQAAVNQVRNVCTFLASKFRIHINNSMGVHVHVGDGKNGLQADVLRMLMATLFVFEPQLDTLHPRNRKGNTYCRSLNAHSKLGQQSIFNETTNTHPKSRSQILEDLLEIKDKKDIVISMSPLPEDVKTHKLA